jgi:hypothetical protein
MQAAQAVRHRKKDLADAAQNLAQGMQDALDDPDIDRVNLRVWEDMVKEQFNKASR